VIAVDTNILVYAHRPECPSHDAAFECIAQLASGPRSWGIVLHCLVEFAAVVTNAKIWRTPSSIEDVIEQVGAWLEAPRLHVLTEDRTWWTVFCETLVAGRPMGGQVHDARIAAACRYHAVAELWTADRDFSRYAGIVTVNPLVEA
jgi:toxin-antitoxin system PIN domain toxin